MKLFILLSVFSFQVFAVYGKDHRLDVYQLKNAKLKEVSQAIAYQVDKHELRGWTFQRFWKIVTKPFTEQGICSNERFAKQEYMRVGCSAVLVTPKHLLMAGNCIMEHYCKNDLYYWMFDYDMKSEDSFNQKVHKKNFYQCEKVVERVYDPSAGVSYALIELEDRVEHIKPIALSDSNEISQTDELITMGHVYGLPLKVAREGRVYDQNEGYFLLNSDIHGSSSGSAVVNARTHELEGIMIHGTADYAYQGGSCKRNNGFENNEAQELAIKVSQIKYLLENL